MSEIIEKKGVKVTIVEHEGGSEEFHVMEEKINEYLNTHSEVDGIFTEDVEAYFCLVQAKKRGISIPRDLIPVHKSLHFQISTGILYFILQRNGMQTGSKHIADIL